MATIKSYTDWQQSKKLAEILPLESADYCWGLDVETLHYNSSPYPCAWKDYSCKEHYVPCWSLAALYGVLPEKYTELIKEGGMYRIIIKDSYMTCLFDNPVDACVAMIIKLHELKKL